MNEYYDRACKSSCPNKSQDEEKSYFVDKSIEISNLALLLPESYAQFTPVLGAQLDRIFHIPHSDYL